MRRVILESPYAGDVDRNLRYLRAAMRDCLSRGDAPFASHGLYTQPGVLDDNDPGERMHGINAGFAWRSAAEATVVYVDLGISRGMELGIEAARAMGHPIEERRIGSSWDCDGAIEVGCEVAWKRLYSPGIGRGTVVSIDGDGTVRIEMEPRRYSVWFEPNERHRLTVVRPAPTRTPSAGTAVPR